jgi:hypothetical protein
MLFQEVERRLENEAAMLATPNLTGYGAAEEGREAQYRAGQLGRCSLRGHGCAVLDVASCGLPKRIKRELDGYRK